MSTLGNKGEKNQGKYKAIDINNLYKGTSVTPQKPAQASNRQHGLQSLGKVANLRRMPPPANLPSLKSENCGVIETSPTPPNSSGWTKEDTVSDNSSLQPKSSPLSQALSPMQDRGPMQMSDGNQNRSLPLTTAGPVLWSNVTSGGRKPGSFLDQKSMLFQEEFPQLPFGSEERIMMPRKEDENRENFHGPGLNIRPQIEGNWKDGGGRPVMLSSEDQLSQSASQLPAAESDGGSAIDGSKPSNVHTAMQFRGPVPVMPVRPGMPPPPPHLGQMSFVPPNFRHMMMPFGFRPGFPPNYPPNFLPPGMPRPPFMNPADMRFQGMYPMQGWNYPCGPGPSPAVGGGTGGGVGDELSSDRPAIVKDKDLEEFDRLAISDDGWARNNIDVDYSERLVFSDEEDAVSLDKSDKLANNDRQSGDQRKDREKDAGSRTRKDPPFLEVQRPVGHDRQPMPDSSGSPLTPKEAWMPMPAQNIRPPPPGDRRQWVAEMPFDGRPSSVPFSQPPFLQQRPQIRPSLSSDGPLSSQPTSGNDPDEDEMWRQRRKQQSESMSAAIERARQRREEEERRMKEEQVAAAREKLRQLDEKLGKKDDKDAPNERSKSIFIEAKDDGRRRNESGDSSSAGGASRVLPLASKSDFGPLSAVDLNDPGLLAPLSSSPSGSTSPRLLQSIPTRLPAPPRATASGYWPYDPRTWNNMPLPPRFMMDPRMFMMSTRSPVSGMPLRMPMRQSSSTEPGVDSHDTNLESAEQSSVRSPWLDQNPYGIYSHGPVGPYDQHVGRTSVPHGYYGLPAQDYEQSEDNCESNQRLPTSRALPFDSYRERAGGFAMIDIPAQMTWAEQSIDDADVEDESRNKPLQSLNDSGHLTKRSSDSLSREMREGSNSDQFGVSRNVAPKTVRHGFDRNYGLNDDDQIQRNQENEQYGDFGQNRKRRDNSSSQKIIHDERYARQNSSSSSSATAVKRTHSSASNSSAASSERKTDSPRDHKTLERILVRDSTDKQLHKTGSQELLKGVCVAKPQETEAEDKLSVSELKVALPTELELLEVKSTRVAEQSVKDDSKVGEAQANANIDRPPAKRIKNATRSSKERRWKESTENERARVGVGSREFVRGGRARMRGASRGRGRGYQEEYDSYVDNRLGFRGSEDEDDHDFENRQRESHVRLSFEEKKKVASSQTGGKMQGSGGGDYGNARNDSSTGQRRDIPRNQRGGTRLQSQANETRTSQRNESASSMLKKDMSAGRRNELHSGQQNVPGSRNELQSGQQNVPVSRNELQSGQQNVSGPRNEQLAAVKNDRQSSPKSDMQSPAELHSGPRIRNSGGRSRRNNRPLDQPRQQTVDKNATDQTVNRNLVQQRSETDKLESTAAPDVGNTNVLLESGSASKRSSGSHRRRRPQKRNTTASSNAEPLNVAMGNIECSGSTELKIDMKPAQNSSGQQLQKSFKDECKPGDRMNRSEDGVMRDSNTARYRQRRETPAKKVSQTQQARGQLPDQMTSLGAANEEWETASESSDVLRGSSYQQQLSRKDRDQQNADKRETKKSFSNQRPAASRRGDHQGDQRRGESGRGMRDRVDRRQVNGGNEAKATADSAGPVARPDILQPATHGSGQNGNVYTVYQLHCIIYDNPQSIYQAFNDVTARYKESSKHTYISKLDNTFSGDFTETDVASVLSGADLQDSGVDLSDIPTSSCCSSPFDDFSSDHNIENAQKRSSTFDFECVPTLTGDEEQLANAINLTSVRSIWQQATSVDSAGVWSTMDFGHAYMQHESVDCSTDLLRAEHYVDSICMTACHPHSLSANSEQLPATAPTSIVTQIDGHQHSITSASLDMCNTVQHLSDELALDLCTDVDIDIVNYKSDENNE